MGSRSRPSQYHRRERIGSKEPSSQYHPHERNQEAFLAKRKAKPQGWWKYERHSDELAPRSIFIKRIIGSLAVALGVIAAGLSVGILGYHFISGFNWIDSLLEASMILGGMGPVREMPNDASKVFASIYALFSGLIVLALMGIMLSPVMHRLMHKFHVDDEDV